SDERLQRPVGCTDVQRMARRQAGAWARRRMRLRRRELIRKHWGPLVRGLGIVLLVATVGITAAAVLFGSWMAWMIVGAVYATLLFAWMSGLEIIDSETRRYAQGADGEELTARQVRRRSRRGWRAVHN